MRDNTVSNEFLFPCPCCFLCPSQISGVRRLFPCFQTMLFWHSVFCSWLFWRKLRISFGLNRISIGVTSREKSGWLTGIANWIVIWSYAFDCKGQLCSAADVRAEGLCGLPQDPWYALVLAGLEVHCTPCNQGLRLSRVGGGRCPQVRLSHRITVLTDGFPVFAADTLRLYLDIVFVCVWVFEPLLFSVHFSNTCIPARSYFSFIWYQKIKKKLEKEDTFFIWLAQLLSSLTQWALAFCWKQACVCAQWRAKGR